MESGHPKAEDKFSFITHEDTRHLRWATTFAMLVAFCKMRDELVPSDLLVGLYVANFERIAVFLPRPELFEDFVAAHCDWSEPRWLTWQRWYEETRKEHRRFRFPLTFWYKGKKLGKRRLHGLMFTQSAEWKRIFENGEKLSPHRVSWRNKILPLLTPEIILLAFIRTEGVLLRKYLLETGLAVEKLEEAALRQIDDPEKLMF